MPTTDILIAGLLVLGGGLADRYGRKIVFLSGFALFGVACLLAAFSTSAEALIVLRALMGVGAACVVAPAPWWEGSCSTTSGGAPSSW
jgi:DHA2 family multidrug resistance protein-like MFS transporter